jgi:hypothetical protein
MGFAVMRNIIPFEFLLFVFATVQVISYLGPVFVCIKPGILPGRLRS